jgi:hypothetical protein
MQLSKMTLFALVGLASAAPVKRSASTIESDISTISSQLSTVDGDVNSFTGSLLQGLVLLTAFDSLQTDVTTATSAITSTGTLSNSDSATIYSDLSALVTKIGTVLTDVTSKASTVSSAGYTNYVLSALTTLQTDADALFVALETYSELVDCKIPATLLLTGLLQSIRPTQAKSALSRRQWTLALLLPLRPTKGAR